MKNVAVVIGPGQIGQAIARRVGIGKHVLLADMRRENADAAATVMANAGYEVSVATVDVSSRAVGKDWWAGIEAAQIHWGSAHVSGYCGYLDYDDPWLNALAGRDAIVRRRHTQQLTSTRPNRRSSP